MSTIRLDLKLLHTATNPSAEIFSVRTTAIHLCKKMVSSSLFYLVISGTDGDKVSISAFLMRFDVPSQ